MKKRFWSPLTTTTTTNSIIFILFFFFFFFFIFHHSSSSSNSISIGGGVGGASVPDQQHQNQQNRRRLLLLHPNSSPDQLPPEQIIHTEAAAGTGTGTGTGTGSNNDMVVGNDEEVDCFSILNIPTADRCAFSSSRCSSSSSFPLFPPDLNYFSIHFCRLNQNPSLSVPILALILLLHFYLLVATATLRFSPAVTRLSSALRLSPSLAGVTLLALGNGAPDAFASLAALRVGRPRLGLGALLSAGAFVSGFVFGVVALHAAPFSVRPSQFFRDGFFYLLAASAAFGVYLTGYVFLWQAAGFVLFYLLFVAIVVWMDLLAPEDRNASSANTAAASAASSSSSSSSSLEVSSWRDRGGHEEGNANSFELDEMDPHHTIPDNSSHHAGGDGSELYKDKDKDKDKEGVANWACAVLRMVPYLWEVPVSTILKLTIPSTSASDWSRFYSSANIFLCPIVLLYYSLGSSSFAFHHPVVFLIPNAYFPLWSVVMVQSFIIAAAHYVLAGPPREGDDQQQLISLIMSFVMSVFWISLVAGELMNCLAAIGVILKLPPALLGLTVLAWGNSVGDLVADVAIAKAGQPAMAIAGCFAGPMFNLLVGFGSALVYRTSQTFPKGYDLIFNSSIVVAFVFLLLSLMGSLLVVTWYRFRVPKFWGFCLVGMYALFLAVSISVSKFSE